jgi:hypothetical protein
MNPKHPLIPQMKRQMMVRSMMKKLMIVVLLVVEAVAGDVQTIVRMRMMMMVIRSCLHWGSV